MGVCVHNARALVSLMEDHLMDDNIVGIDARRLMEDRLMDDHLRGILVQLHANEIIALGGVVLHSWCGREVSDQVARRV